MASKLPWFKFSPYYWTSDTQLSLCKPATRGIWIDLICAMHNNGRSGKITGNLEQLAVFGRCTVAEISDALDDLKTHKTANVTIRNKNVTVINRRMEKEYNDRKDIALRVRRHRKKNACNGFETGENKENKENKEIKALHVWAAEKKNFMDDGPWQLKFCATKNLALKTLQTAMSDFVADIELRGEFKDFRELQRHFTNWFNKKHNGNHAAPAHRETAVAPPLKKI